MDPDDPLNASVVEREHALWFGVIINTFAQIEVQMQIAVAGMLDTDITTALILMGETHYHQKQGILRSLNATIGINGRTNDDLIQILDCLGRHTNLRNAIAHSVWTKGRRPTAIKPMQLKGVRSGKPVPVGHHHNEPEHTPETLRDAAIRLDAISRKLTRLVQETGLAACVDAKIAAIKPLTSSSPGQPSSK